jgi:hypothetical protein
MRSLFALHPSYTSILPPSSASTQHTTSNTEADIEVILPTYYIRRKDAPYHLHTHILPLLSNGEDILAGILHGMY